MRVSKRSLVERHRIAGIAALVSALVVCAAVTPARAAEAPDIYTGAAVFRDAPSGADPCVTQHIFVDVVDRRIPNETDEVFFFVAESNPCTGQEIRTYVSPGSPYAPVDEGAFFVSDAHTVGQLRVTLPAIEFVSQTESLVTLDLRWERQPGAPSNNDAVVTGHATVGDLTVVLDSSITWNPWTVGSPMAGFWPLCVLTHPGRPLCFD